MRVNAVVELVNPCGTNDHYAIYGGFDKLNHRILNFLVIPFSLFVTNFSSKCKMKKPAPYSLTCSHFHLCLSLHRKQNFVAINLPKICSQVKV